MVELKRVRRKISREMMEAHRRGRLGQYMKNMERKAEKALREAGARAKTKKRAQA